MLAGRHRRRGARRRSPAGFARTTARAIRASQVPDGYLSDQIQARLLPDGYLLRD